MGAEKRTTQNMCYNEHRDKKDLNVVLSSLTVALMMASPVKHVSITMEESRPLLEAKVKCFLLTHLLCSLQSAQFDLM